MSDPRRDVRAYDEVLAQLGEANSRRSIPTPALVCDLSLLLANIERMANRARDAGCRTTAHVKSPQIGLRRRAPTGGRGRRARLRQVERSRSSSAAT